MLFLLLAVIATPAIPQATTASSTTSIAPAEDPQFGQRRGEPDADEVKMEQKRQKLRNKARQAEIKKDTDRLLQLSQELKEYVDKTTENTLSLDVIRKAEEVEKLAKRVKDKMKAG